jgi:hypothetical protein
MWVLKYILVGILWDRIHSIGLFCIRAGRIKYVTRNKDVTYINVIQSITTITSGNQYIPPHVCACHTSRPQFLSTFIFFYSIIWSDR